MTFQTDSKSEVIVQKKGTPENDPEFLEISHPFFFLSMSSSIAILDYSTRGLTSRLDSLFPCDIFIVKIHLSDFIE
jgi:hypothetical protein